MKWADVLRDVAVVKSSDADAEIASVECDSRRLKAGAAFVAMRGGVNDGNWYIDAAVAQGLLRL